MLAAHALPEGTRGAYAALLLAEATALTRQADGMDEDIALLAEQAGRWDEQLQAALSYAPERRDARDRRTIRSLGVRLPQLRDEIARLEALQKRRYRRAALLLAAAGQGQGKRGVR